MPPKTVQRTINHHHWRNSKKYFRSSLISRINSFKMTGEVFLPYTQRQKQTQQIIPEDSGDTTHKDRNKHSRLYPKTQEIQPKKPLQSLTTKTVSRSNTHRQHWSLSPEADSADHHLPTQSPDCTFTAAKHKNRTNVILETPTNSAPLPDEIRPSRNNSRAINSLIRSPSFPSGTLNTPSKSRGKSKFTVNVFMCSPYLCDPPIDLSLIENELHTYARLGSSRMYANCCPK